MEVFRILIAYEPEYLAYAQAFRAAIRITEPSADVLVARPHDLHRSLPSFGPHLVVSDEAADAFPAVEAWFRLSTEPEEPSEMRLGHKRWVCTNPDLGAFTRVVEAVGGLVREGRLTAAV